MHDDEPIDHLTPISNFFDTNNSPTTPVSNGQQQTFHYIGYRPVTNNPLDIEFVVFNYSTCESHNHSPQACG